MKFDDEEDLFEGQCKFCGRINGHEPECIMLIDGFIEPDKPDSDASEDFREL